MWAMKGESRISSSSQMTCTAYSPGSVGQYRTSQEPSPLSSHSILACEGPSMEKPGERWEGSESIRCSQQPGLRQVPPCSLLLPAQLPLCPHSVLILTAFHVSLSSPAPPWRQSFLSHVSCHPATYPASPLLCRWLPPRSQLTCPPGQSPTQDPMRALSGLQPLGSPGPQKD